MPCWACAWFWKNFYQHFGHNFSKINCSYKTTFSSKVYLLIWDEKSVETIKKPLLLKFSRQPRLAKLRIDIRTIDRPSKYNLILVPNKRWKCVLINITVSKSHYGRKWNHIELYITHISVAYAEMRGQSILRHAGHLSLQRKPLKYHFAPWDMMEEHKGAHHWKLGHHKFFNSIVCQSKQEFPYREGNSYPTH